MSGPERPEPAVPTTPSLKRKHLSDDQRHDLDALDNIFKRIKTKVPRTPYILSTPSLDPYRYHSQQEANAWTMGGLWRHDEEHIQYRTYLYREPCQDCFELQAGEGDEPERERERTKTVAADVQPVKKKVNLSTFKVKQANGTTTPGMKTSSPSLAPIKHGPDKTNGVKESEKSNVSAVNAKPKSPKRSSEKPQDEHRTKDTINEASDSGPRVRPPTSQNSHAPKSKSNGSPDNSNGTPHGLPPLLSPVHEPLGNPYGLPNILSPTLPANIQTELNRLEEKRKRADSNTSTSSSDRKSQTLTVPGASTLKSGDTPKTEDRVRSVSVNGKSPNPETASRAEEKDSTLVVKLKFSKTKAPTVKQILRLPPKRANAEGKERQETTKEPSKEGPVKVSDGPVIKKKPIPKVAARRGESTTQPTTPSTNIKTSTVVAKVLEKRPRTDDDAASSLPSKRPRALSTQDRPITPVQSTSSPASTAKAPTQKNQTQYTTPKKDTKAVSMLRTASTESHDTTPGRSGGTPAGSKLDPKAGPTSAPLTGKKQADIGLLAQTSMKLNQMGRALKHEATKILTAAGNKLTKQDEKRAAVTNLECILSYMAAYYAQDFSLNLRGRPGEVEQTWKTLLPLCLSYARSTKDFPHLDGLRSYLSSIIASAICTHVSQRAASTRAHDSPHDIPHADLARQHSSLAENFALLADHTIKMHRHYQDARIALPIEDLQTLYKKTYAAREVNARVAREPEKVSGARLSGPFFFPLAMDSSPIQAVRFGLRFLAEYCEREGVEYGFRVNLDRPE